MGLRPPRARTPRARPAAAVRSRARGRRRGRAPPGSRAARRSGPPCSPRRSPRSRPRAGLRRRGRGRGRRRRRTGPRRPARTWAFADDLGGDLRVVLEAGQEGRRQRRDEHRPGERGPERGTEVGHGVLQPADVTALLVGHGRDGHGTELGGERADAEPGEQQRDGDDLGARARPPAPAMSATMPSSIETQAPADDLARRAVRQEPRDPDRGDQQGHRQRQQPHARLEAPTGRARPTGRAGRRRTARPGSGTGRRTSSARRPAVAFAQQVRRRTSGSVPAARTRRSHEKNSRRTTSPASTSQTSARARARRGRPAWAATHPHSPDRSTPKTARPRPAADRTTPTTSSRNRASGSASAILRVSTRMPTTSTTSPANTYRQVQ